ncbi:TolC family outer membrane protein [Sulfurimonas sp.]|uniref:TolC family outer membrane protein n=1 Tax=Sulfurimonas sp. TaxID=2022749 RepID=UPI00356573E9
MKRFPLLTLSLLPALLSAISITEVVQNTIQTHPQIQVKKESVNVNKQRLTQVRAGYMPSVDLSYSVGPERTKTPANLREEAKMTRQEASATLTQNVFAGLNTMYGMKEQESLILSASSTVVESANSLALEATTAYLDVLKTLELYNIAKENVKVHDKYLKQIKEKVDAGIARSSDYEQTLSRYENAKTAEYLAEQNHFIAAYSFERILPGIAPADLEKPVPGAIPADTVEGLVDIAMKENPTITVSKNDIEAAKSAVSRANAPYYPSADVVIRGYWNDSVHGVGYNTVTNENDLESEDSGYSGMIVLNYNIFNGLSDSANKQANQHILLQQNSTLADAKLYIKANTKIAWVTYEMTKKQLVYIDKNIKASAQTVSDYQQENELGRRSIIDLLNIELEYNNAKNRKVNAVYDNLSAYYEILSHTGKMLEEMNVVIK